MFAGASGGNQPTPIYFGGLDTLRGFDLYTLAGDRAFFTNIEFRFPFVDVLATPVLGFQGIRGSIFLDVGGAWYDFLGQGFRFWNGDENRLQDAVSAYGYGISVHFLGLQLNWDVAKQWDFKDSLGGYRTSFWVGTRF